MIFSHCASKKFSENNSSPESNKSENALLTSSPEANLNPENAPTNPRIGVLIRSVGLDSFAALGFLEELEKRGHKIDFIAGTGFACWIAKNWAARNKGNFAEWQSFKFSEWKALESSILDRVSAKRALKRFDSYLAKISSTQRKDLDAIPWACPLFLERDASLSIVSGRELSFSENFMKELELESLGLGPFSNSPEFKSGTRYDYPLDDWVTSLEKIWMNNIAENRAWLIIDTSFTVLEWSKLSNTHDTGSPNDNLKWARVLVAKMRNPTASQVKDFDLRRSFLLEGRQTAKDFFDNPRYQQFFAW